jgi:type I restriction enzyme S subunit
MSIVKYIKYKPSGVDWLECKIPDHWKVLRNKRVFKEISKPSKTGNETLLTVSHITGVSPRSEKNVNMFFAETMKGYKLCKEGDLIINTMWAWMGALGTSKYDGICSPAYNVYRKINGVDFYHQYFDYLYRTPNFVVEMTKYSKGIVESRLRLYPKDFFRINTIVPPVNEQIAISNYLNSKTDIIDRKIALLEQKIIHYKQIRRSLINVTVCRGLEKNVKLKDSGIEWVGKIPAHWDIMRLKDKFNLYTGNSIADKFLFESKGNSFDYISTKDIDIETGQIIYDNGVYIPKSEKSFKIAKANSILLCIEGGSAGKKVAFVFKDVCFVNKLCSISGKTKKVNTKYQYYCIQSLLFENHFFSIINGVIGGVSLNLIKLLIFYSLQFTNKTLLLFIWMKKHKK